MPSAEPKSGRELIFSATKNDFIVETFRSGGPGGQHQNKTDSGVRIIHKATGLRAESREYRSQYQNKKIAFRRLATLILQTLKGPKNNTINTEIIRTYHKPDNRVKDHFSGYMSSYDNVVENRNIGPMLEARLMEKIKDNGLS
jgi:protein subunit release factor A